MAARLAESDSTVRIEVIPNTAVVPIFNASLTKGDLIAIGSMEPRKNQEFLLRVLAEAGKTGHRYTLTLVGDGESQPKLEALTAQLGLSDQVTFAGRQPDAASWIPSHHLFVHAALMDNFPISHRGACRRHSHSCTSRRRHSRD